jgi:hypothetical protein
MLVAEVEDDVLDGWNGPLGGPLGSDFICPFMSTPPH